MTETLKDKAKKEAVKKKNWSLLISGGLFVAGAAGLTVSPDLQLFVGEVLVAAGSALVDSAKTAIDAAANLPV